MGVSPISRLGVAPTVFLVKTLGGEFWAPHWGFYKTPWGKHLGRYFLARVFNIYLGGTAEKALRDFITSTRGKVWGGLFTTSPRYNSKTPGGAILF